MASGGAQAYPQFISHGYTSCALCHYNAWGGGALTDYGRALGATVFSGRPFWAADLDDDRLGEHSGFLGNPENLPEQIRPQLNYRGLLLNSNLGHNSQARYINMVAGASLALRPASDSPWLLMLEGGLHPSSDPAHGVDFISREHYLRYLVRKDVGLSLGLMDRIYGLRIPDHIASSRVLPLVSMDDQSHAFLVDWSRDSFQYGLQLLSGNLYQEKDFRLWGAAFSGEQSLGEKLRLGASVSVLRNHFRHAFPASLHLRWGLPHNSSLLSELGLMYQDFPERPQAPAEWGQYFFTQGSFGLKRGLDLLFFTDYSTPNAFRPALRTLRWGPALQYDTFQRLELRMDLEHVAQFGPGARGPLRLNLMSQLHLYF